VVVSKLKRYRFLRAFSWPISSRSADNATSQRSARNLGTKAGGIAERAMVPTLTMKGTGDEPVTLAALGVAPHVVAWGTLLQLTLKVTEPVKPASGAIWRL